MRARRVHPAAGSPARRFQRGKTSCRVSAAAFGGNIAPRTSTPAGCCAAKAPIPPGPAPGISMAGRGAGSPGGHGPRLGDGGRFINTLSTTKIWGWTPVLGGRRPSKLCTASTACPVLMIRTVVSARGEQVLYGLKLDRTQTQKLRVNSPRCPRPPGSRRPPVPSSPVGVRARCCTNDRARDCPTPGQRRNHFFAGPLQIDGPFAEQREIVLPSWTAASADHCPRRGRISSRSWSGRPGTG